MVRNISDLVRSTSHKTKEKVSQMMVAQTSHDLRTPLNTIGSMLHLLKVELEKLGAVNPSVDQYLKVCDSSARMMTFLASDTLDFFQIKSGHFKVKLEKTNLLKLAEETMSII